VTLDTLVAGYWPGTAEELAGQIHGEPVFVPLDVAQLYIHWAWKFKLRADILWGMTRLETADFHFGGDVTPSQNNPCGLRKPDGSGFYSFPTLADGVRAHCAHVAWHVFKDHINEWCNVYYDPKHSALHPNDVKILKDLDVWSTKGYAKKVLVRVNE